MVRQKIKAWPENKGRARQGKRLKAFLLNEMIKSRPIYISAKNDNSHKKTMAIKNNSQKRTQPKAWPKIKLAKIMAQPKERHSQTCKMAKGM